MENDLKEDHCTNAPDELFGYYLGDACKEHDLDYWLQAETRKEADIELRENLKSKLPFRLHWIAWIYYSMVRLFGWTKWRKK